MLVDWDAKPVAVKPAAREVRGNIKHALTTLESLWPVDGDPVISIDAFLGKYAESLVHGDGPDNRITKAMTKLNSLVEQGIVDVDNARKTVTLLRSNGVSFGPPVKEDSDADIL
jgi:hypothetical protein